MNKNTLIAGGILSLLAIVGAGTYLVTAKQADCEEQEFHERLHVAEKPPFDLKTKNDDDPRVAEAKELVKKLAEENKLSTDPWSLQKALVSDMVIDELAGRYAPTKIFRNLQEVQSDENIEMKIQVFTYPDGEKAVEITDKSFPTIQFCYFVSENKEGHFGINNSFVHGYEFLHRNMEWQPVLPLKNIYEPYHGMKDKIQLERQDLPDRYYGTGLLYRS